MPLLDHKYEVLKQRVLDGRQTLFEATAPDGTAVSIVWFELESPEQELVFERYRQALRALRAQGLAAIYDLVSRPGAHYVAWHAGGAPASDHSSKESRAIGSLLTGYGYGLRAADLRLEPGQGLKVFGLSFDGSQSPALPFAPPRQQEAEAAAPGWRSRLDALPAWCFAWLPAAVLALAGMLLFYLSFTRQAENRVVSVPALLGAEVNEAARALYHLSLQVQVEATPSDATPGKVLGLDPSVGSRLRPGRSIRVKYAVPAGQLPTEPVPDLLGRPLGADGGAKLLPGGLTLGRVARIPASAPAGIVLGQSQPAGSKPPGGIVDLLVSAGPEPQLTFLPPLTGLELRVAIELARDAGLSAIEEEYVPESRAPVGTVISQNVAPYTYVSRAATLRLSVSGSQAPAIPLGRRVPDLILMSKEQAVRSLGAARFALGSTDLVYLPGLPEGVIEQDPPPGAPPKGNTVDLTLNLHPLDISRPGVTAVVRQPEPRNVPFSFSIEPGIPTVTAEVYATTAQGDTELVLRRQARGGETLQSRWRTRAPGPVVFELRLSGFPYKELRVNPVSTQN